MDTTIHVLNFNVNFGLKYVFFIKLKVDGKGQICVCNRYNRFD